MKHSAYYYQISLRRYGRIFGMNEFGIDESHFGCKLLAINHGSTVAFVIDQRGHKLPIVRAIIPFYSRADRRDAFRIAKAIFNSVKNTA